MPDPFAQYVVTEQDPFAAFVEAEEPSADPAYMTPEWMDRWIAEREQTPTNWGAVAATAAAPAAFRLASKVPAGRIISSVWGGAKRAGASLPLVGRPTQQFIRGARDAWKASAPKPAVSHPQPTPTPTAKPKLSAAEAAQYLRKEYGSEKAGRMLYGHARPNITAAGRTEAIKRLAPGESQLPGAAQRAIQEGIRQGSADDAWRFALRAPNAKAREFLIALMRSRQP